MIKQRASTKHFVFGSNGKSDGTLIIITQRSSIPSLLKQYKNTQTANEFGNISTLVYCVNKSNSSTSLSLPTWSLSTIFASSKEKCPIVVYNPKYNMSFALRLNKFKTIE